MKHLLGLYVKHN